MGSSPFKLPKEFTVGFSNIKKPTIPVEIDWSNPLTEGLVGCWLFNTGGGETWIDLTGNNTSLGDSHEVERKVSQGVEVANFTGASNSGGISLGESTLPLSFHDTNECSFIFKANLRNNGAGSARLIARGTNGNMSDGWALWFASSNRLLKFGIDNDYANEMVAGTAFEYGVPHTQGLSYSGVDDTGYWYFNGDTDGNTTESSPAFSDATRKVGIGNRGDRVGGDRQLEGDLHFLYVYNKVISSNEHKSLYEQPYQILMM